MPPLQSAHSRSPSENLPGKEPELCSSTDNAPSQQIHQPPGDASVRGPYVSLGYTPQLHAKELLELRQSQMTSPLVPSDAPHLNTTSSNNSQSTVYTDVTPPTTSSGPSSQSQRSQLTQISQRDSSTQNTTVWSQDRTTAITVDLDGDTAALSVHTTPTSPANASFPAEGLIHGQKRTASGAVKPASTSLPASPVEVVGRSHSRNTSMNSTGTQIAEVISVILSNRVLCLLTHVLIAVFAAAHAPFLCHGQGAKRLASPLAR